jgi:RNA polymerase sigma factor (TIGR02999 family)
MNEASGPDASESLPLRAADDAEGISGEVEGIGRADPVHIFLRAASGDHEAMGRAVTAVYDELRRIARAEARRSRTGSLQPTAIVHETYMRLCRQRSGGWRDERSFVAVAARIMRRVLVDQARSALRQRRGAGRHDQRIDDDAVICSVLVEDRRMPVMETHELLAALERSAPEEASVAECIIFGGLSIERIADLHGCSARTIDRRWRFARAWLLRALGEGRREVRS